MHEAFVRQLVKRLIRLYMHFWHDLELRGQEHIPPGGPLLIFANHASILDTAVLVALDPYPHSMLVAKASTFRVPIVRELLRAWSAIPVERAGNDLGGIRALLVALRRGHPVGLAPEGRRSRTGRLQPINPLLARLAARSGVPVLPVGIAGSFAAMPPGARFPRRRKIVVRVGPPFLLDPSLPDAAAARHVEGALAVLLPPDQQPEDSGGNDALWRAARPDQIHQTLLASM